MGYFKVYAGDVNGVVYTRIETDDFAMLTSFCGSNNVFPFPQTNIVQSDKVNIPQVEKLIETFSKGSFSKYYNIKRGSVRRCGNSVPANLHKAYAATYTW